ncbi:hypothetical protein [Zavarzinia compransoris]|uniref:hypothetical protein n=1 Tax=Zavarzinia compransoris TaxID=1264899 RepID=UPI00105F4969|nr:hypothetical protein [Zavarzinia compransoris]
MIGRIFPAAVMAVAAAILTTAGFDHLRQFETGREIQRLRKVIEDAAAANDEGAGQRILTATEAILTYPHAGNFDSRTQEKAAIALTTAFQFCVIQQRCSSEKREAMAEGAQGFIKTRLAGAPADTYSWMRIAWVHLLSGRPWYDLRPYMRMVIRTGVYEPALIRASLAIMMPFWNDLDDEERLSVRGIARRTYGLPGERRHLAAQAVAKLATPGWSVIMADMLVDSRAAEDINREMRILLRRN